MKRVTFNVSDLVYYRLKEYARNEAGTTMSRAGADILADFLAEDDEVIESQTTQWGGYRERIDDGDSGAAYERVNACKECGRVVYDGESQCPECDGAIKQMLRSESQEIKTEILRRRYES
jgi:rubrerythrin